MANFPIIGGFGTLEDVQSGNETTINAFAQKHQGKTEWRLRNTPGLKPFMELSSSPIRAAREVNGRAFVVAGTAFFEIFDDASSVFWGSLTNDLDTRVVMDDNGLQLMFTDGVAAYVFTFETDEFVKVNDVDWYPSKSLAVVDGFAVFARDGTGQYFYSDLYEAKTYLPSDFASAESNPDILIGMANDPVGLLGIGTKSLETYWNTGDAVQVFQRRQGAKINIGCRAVYSIVTVENGTMWIGADTDGLGGVYRLFGGAPTKISTPAIDEILGRSERLSEATAFAYKQAGNTHYVLNVPDLDTTLVYDIVTSIWHERRSFNDEVWGRWWAECHMSAFGKNIVGDYRTGALYELDLDHYFDGNTQIIRRERILRPVFDYTDNLRAIYEGLELDMLFGVGDVNPPYDDPQVVLQVSRDGGHTYDSERAKSVGQLGEYKQRVKFRRLAISRVTSFKIIYTYPTPFAINAAYISARR